MTSSFTNLVLAARSLAGPGERSLRERGETGGRRAARCSPSAPATSRRWRGERTPTVVYLGSGGRLGAAHESALKMLESNGGRVVTIADSFLGLRHGPMAAVGEESLIVAFLSTDPVVRAYERDVLLELQRKGLGRWRLVVGERIPAGARAGARGRPHRSERRGPAASTTESSPCWTPWPASCSPSSAVSTEAAGPIRPPRGSSGGSSRASRSMPASNGAKRVLVVGEINVDLICQGYHAFPTPGREVLVDDFQMVLGSASAICAMGLARLGTPVDLLRQGRRRPDGALLPGRDARAGHRSGCRGRGSRAEDGSDGGHHLARRSRARVVSRVDRALSEKDVPRALFSAADHVHVSSYYLQEALRPGVGTLFREARAAGLTTSLDPGFDPSERWEPDMLETLAHTDVFFPNEVELRALTRRDDPEEAVRSTAARPDPRHREARRRGRDGDRRRGPARPRSRPARSRWSTRRARATRSTPASSMPGWAAPRSPTACGSASPAAPSRRAVSAARPRQADLAEARAFLAARG